MRRKISEKFAALFAVASVLALTGCGLMGSEPPTYLVIKGFDSPESVVPSPDGRRVYVSNVGKKLLPSDKDGDGFISELTHHGEVVNKRFLPARGGVLNAPKGMAIIDRTLYVTDIDRVVGFDLDTREQVFELDLSAEKTVFLNDITVMDDTTLLVSATDTGKIYSVSLVEGQAYTVLVDDAPGVNGLYFDPEGRKLYAVGFGTGGEPNGALWVAEFENGLAVFERLTGAVGLLDGVSLMPDGRVLFSDWMGFGRPGVLRVYDPETGKVSAVELSEEVKGPADFYYDAKKRAVWLPRMVEGKVMVEEIDAPRQSD